MDNKAKYDCIITHPAEQLPLVALFCYRAACEAGALGYSDAAHILEQAWRNIELDLPPFASLGGFLAVREA